MISARVFMKNWTIPGHGFPDREPAEHEDVPPLAGHLRLSIGGADGDGGAGSQHRELTLVQRFPMRPDVPAFRQDVHESVEFRRPG
jgi:hypothetical protein